MNAKPFLKWAGGKTQLLDEFYQRLPQEILTKKEIETYIEPFVGGGAMFFYLKNHFTIKKSYLMDINPELILGYKVIQNSSLELIHELKKIEQTFFLKSEVDREKYFYEMREKYNSQKANYNEGPIRASIVKRAANLIFLNKTCYNGLFRLNQSGKFNVPFGSYKNPTICDEKNICEVQQALADTEIILSDFSCSGKWVDQTSFIYLDPPYRPLNRTSNFTSYVKNGFSDNDQKRLADYFAKMGQKGAKLMLSNSDPQNEDPNDLFFDDLYRDFRIERVLAKRFINSDATKRGDIRELIIRNY